MPDAVARALEALYDIWEYWQKSVGLTISQQDGVVTGDADGETAAGLVFLVAARRTTSSSSVSSRMRTATPTTTTTGPGAGSPTAIRGSGTARGTLRTPATLRGMRFFRRCRLRFAG